MSCHIDGPLSENRVNFETTIQKGSTHLKDGVILFLLAHYSLLVLTEETVEEVDTFLKKETQT